MHKSRNDSCGWTMKLGNVLKPKRKGSGKSHYLFLRCAQISFACSHLADLWKSPLSPLFATTQKYFRALFLPPALSSFLFHWLSRLPKTDPISHCLLTHIPLPEPRLSPYSLLGLSNLFSPLCHSPLLIFQVFTDSLSLDICSLCCIT